MFKTIMEFRKVASRIEKSTSAAMVAYTDFVYDGLRFFNNQEQGNHNDEVLQTIVNIAYNAQGIKAKTVIEYISRIIPHKIIVDRDNKNRRTFSGKTSKEVRYPTMGELEQYIFEHKLFDENPKNDNPETWDVDVFHKKMSSLLLNCKRKSEKELKTDPFNDEHKRIIKQAKLLLKIIHNEVEVEDETDTTLNVLTDVSLNNDSIIQKMMQEVS